MFCSISNIVINNFVELITCSIFADNKGIYITKLFVIINKPLSAQRKSTFAQYNHKICLLYTQTTCSHLILKHHLLTTAIISYHISMFVILKFNCNTNLWVLMPCNMVATHQYFFKTYSLHHLQLRRKQQVPLQH